MPVHQIGLPADMDAILALADATGWRSSRTRRARSARRYKRPARSARSSSLACFSLHPRKVITTGEGGMITVHDPSVAERLRLLRQHAHGRVGPRAPRAPRTSSSRSIPSAAGTTA